MRFFLVTAALLLSCAAAEQPEHKKQPKHPQDPQRPNAGCSLTASGGDDSPQLLAAVKACPTVTIPKATTLNIATRLNMTGLTNKHIVSHPLQRL